MTACGLPWKAAGSARPHQKKVQLFGALLAESILYPVLHRQFVFGIPRCSARTSATTAICSKNLCRVAHECLIEFLRTSLGLPEGIPGIVMAIHTFGEYLGFPPQCTRWWPTGCLRVRGSSTSCPRPISSPWRNSSAPSEVASPRPGGLRERSPLFFF